LASVEAGRTGEPGAWLALALIFYSIDDTAQFHELLGDDSIGHDLNELG
jgi:hypothetical protein